MNALASKPRCRLVKFGLVARQAAALAGFYERAFGCRRDVSGNLDASQSERFLGVPGTTQYITVRLGKELIDFLQFEQPGRPYPPAFSASDLLFQHFAIVVSEMRLALERLCAASGWTSITRGGPQRLPESSGGVTVFKFRDPAGHPLELLEFPRDRVPPKWRQRPEGIFLGIDHSAITVRDTITSQRFYSGLGFLPFARSINRGPEQENLDNVPGAVVEVTALSSGDDGPHIELLCYRNVGPVALAVCDSHDTAATRLELEIAASSVSEGQDDKLLDPDGHHLIVLERGFGWGRS